MRASGRPSNRRTGGTPKYLRIREMLRQKILDGTYAPGAQLPPDTEFHKTLRVNKLTAVRALNDLAREGLLIRRQGSGSYVADPVQRPLAPGRHLRIGVLWKIDLRPRTLLEDFKGEITRGVLEILGLSAVQPGWPRTGEHEATRAEWTSTTRGITVVGLGEARGEEVKHPPLEEIAAARLDGLITVSIIAQEFLDRLVRLGLPTVLADHLHERFALSADQVFVDPLPAHRAVVCHLAAQGLKRIHFVGGYTALPAPSPEMTSAEVEAFRQGRMQVDPDSFLRMSAWRQGMAECGLDAPERWTHFENPFFVKERELAGRLLALPERERPEAVLCHSLQQAVALQEVFAERGVRLAAAGTTDRGYGGPALAIRAHGREIGAAAAELLISRLQRPGRLRLRVGVPMLFTPPDAEPMVQAVALIVPTTR